jgi:RNA polymerase sigma factor (sigma-70 family)
LSQAAPPRVPTDVRDPTDGLLVEGLRRGDRSAFDGAYERYRTRVYGFLLRLSGRADVADDLFQETWLKLARHASRQQEDTDLPAWLFAVARNAWVSHRRWTLLDMSRLLALTEQSATARRTEPEPEARHDAARRISVLEQALVALSPDLREVILLVCVQGFEQEAAARILGISYDALRQRLARARARLAEKMAALHSEGEGSR